uniref:Desmoplakin SH3 domain-containing protein n=1 Tax=Panagrolaimus sp. PS1159 TaxID=55785 RepID=A0AC35G9P8_9BILA
YLQDAKAWLEWVKNATELMYEKELPQNLEELEKLVDQLNKFQGEDLPPMEDEKDKLKRIYSELVHAFMGTNFLHVPTNLQPQSLDQAWDELLKAMEFRYEILHEQLGIQGNLDDIISRLTRGIGIVNEKLDLILRRIEEVEARADTADPAEIRRAVQELVEDLEAIEAPINDLFDDVDILKQHNHPRTDEFYRQVYGLHQRRTAYLDRLNNQILTRIGIRTDTMSRRSEERTKSLFHNLEEAIRWVREKSEKLDSMVFHEDLETLEEVFEQHKIDNRDIQDFDQTVKECIARQAEISAEESHEYCELLAVLESEYQQLRDLSAGRMLDLDSLIAFIRAAQLELIWIHEREDIEVTRNWSNIERLDLPMLQNYFKQLLHEIELREKRFNDVHNQGAALLNQRHPAVEVIEIYLRSLQNQWDWLLGLTKCLEGHLRDALNLKSFQEEVAVIEEWIKSQTEHLENNYNQTNFSVEEGERWLRELNEIREVIQRYHNLLMTLAERSAQISPLWQRGERIRQPIPVTAWCDYKGKDIEIRAGDEVTLIDNSDLINWTVRGVDGVQATVPSVVFRIPPPDPQLTQHLARLAAQLDKMRKLWDRKHRMIRFNMMISTMKSIQGWDLDTFLSYPPEQRDEIIKALNDDVNKLLAEMDPNDPLALRLKEELRRTNDHFLDLLNQSLRGPESDLSSQFDERLAELLKKLEEAWKKLNERTAEGVPKTVEDLERLILQQVLQGIDEVTDIVRRHEITLSSFDDMPSALDSLRGVHAQLLELNMVLQQQEHIIHQLNKNTAQLRQHVARTRFNVASHPDVDRLEEQVQQLTVRWDNVCSQVTDRLKVAEESQQTQMVYRSQYDEEIQWLDRVENTINKLRKPETLSPDELQQQLEQLMAEYRQLQEHTATIENINKEGGKFIREAKNYDNSLNTFREHITTIHGPGIRNEFRRTQPQPKNGAQIVTEELEALNRRFAELSSVILERRNQLNILIQNWKRKQQVGFKKTFFFQIFNVV